MANTDKIIKTPIVNKLKKSTFESITPSEDEFYLVDPEFKGNKLLVTDSNGNIVETDTNYATENYVQNYHDTTKQDVITDLSDIRVNAQTGADLAPQVAVNTQRIEDLTTARIPDVIYHGTPKITGGQISNFSTVNYLQFPFEDISRGLPFDIYFSFTTDDDVTTQQNIIDSKFGIALAILNGKGVMALSSNGTNWDIGSVTGTFTLSANTTYYVKYSWTGTEYKTYISTNNIFDTTDMVLPSTLSPYKTTIYIGGCDQNSTSHTPHPFKGIINFSKSRVDVNGITVWEGMADVGIASRANVSLTNLDEVGEKRFTDLQDVIDSKQSAGDNTLTTTNKTIVGAINELNAKPSMPSLDGVTIDLNLSNELQAIGVIEKNKNGTIYDWVGTLQEYESQGVGTTHPDWVCYITDDYSESVGVSEEEVNAIVQKNLVTSLSETSTDTQYPSAKCIYNILNSLKQELEEL